MSCVGGGNGALHLAAPEKAPQSNNILAQSTLFWRKALGKPPPAP
jgi:hypothetical protein